MDTLHDSAVLNSDNIEKINEVLIPIGSTLDDQIPKLVHSKSASFEPSEHVFKVARLNSDESSQRTTPSSSSNSLDSQQSSSHPDSTEDDTGNTDTYCRLTDPRGPFQVSEHVKLTVQRWGVLAAIAPDQFLKRILSSRGYSTDMMPAMSSPYRQQPTRKQMEDYDSELVKAVRSSDLDKIRSLRNVGRSMTACNRFGESIVHMACRRADFDVVDFLLENTGGVWGVDDYGRTPLHDACWRPEPRFDIVTCLLDKNLHLLRVLDVRGAKPPQLRP